MHRPMLTTNCLDRAVDVDADAVGVHDALTACEAIVGPDSGDSGARLTGGSSSLAPTRSSGRRSTSPVGRRTTPI